jgi:hypothetical protein
MPHATTGNGKHSPHDDEPNERAWLTLHVSDPITYNGQTLYTLFNEEYWGYTIYSTDQGRCCKRGKHRSSNYEASSCAFLISETPRQPHLPPLGRSSI